MNDDDKQRAQALVNRLLHEAEENTHVDAFRAALTAVKKAKALDQSNVYLLALERQVEQIDELVSAGTLTEAQKADIVGSVPRLVEQAIQSNSALTRPGERNVERKETPEEAEARLAAGRWLKNQYFQRAHEFVREGKYDQALTELRKIFSVDDQDKVARDFEMKILQMLELQRRQPIVTNVIPEVVQPAIADPIAPSAPARAAVAPVPGRGRGKGTIWIAVIVTIVAISFAAFYFWKRHQTTPAVPQIREQVQEKPEEAPIYPVPPPVLAPDTTAKDSTARR
jgi:antitoxin component HigA of HigAB toxin-antitoxin module